jgi:alpha-beta hydrolase superfamily lysophospholipase
MASSASLTETEGTVAPEGGPRLHWRSWLPRSPRALVLIVHGAAEHGGRHAETARGLAARGYGCYAVDCRGHGRSGGARVHVEGFGEYLADVDAGLALVRERHAGARAFLLGHSQGGLIVLLHALRHPAGRPGVVATSPLLGLHPDLAPSGVRRAAVRVLLRVAPRLRVPSGVDPAGVSRDPAVVEAYRRDPLVSRRVSSRWLAAAREGMDEAHQRAPALAVPALVMAAGDDRLVDARATRRFVARAPASLVEYVEWPGLFHEILNEPERAEVRARITTWLDARLG